MICSQRYLVRDDSSFANWVLAESLWDILANLISSKGWCRCVKSVINGTNLKAICLFAGDYLSKANFGGLAEWSIAAVLKTVDPKGSVGSNPTASALKT